MSEAVLMQRSFSIQNLLEQSELELIATQERLAKSVSEASDAAKQILQLEAHASALQDELDRVCSQSASREETSLHAFEGTVQKSREDAAFFAKKYGELQQQFDTCKRARDEAQDALSASRIEKASLYRKIALLDPQAQSNVAAMRVIRELTIEKNGLQKALENTSIPHQSMRTRLTNIFTFQNLKNSD